MRATLILTILASAACGTAPRSGTDGTSRAIPKEAHIPVGQATLFAREIGNGQPVIVLHGGPDFDQNYLLPDLDRLSDSFRLIYYDQRGSGKSAEGVRPEDVTVESEMTDLDAVMRHFQLGSAVLLGHSWGTVLALEYVLRHPDRVSHLILMNPAPASADDYVMFRKARQEQLGERINEMRAIAATDAFKQGDPDAVAAYYRIHFATAVAKPEDLDRLMTGFRASFHKEGVLKARAVEDHLMKETWMSPKGYDLLPRLATVAIPTLVIYGDHDFIPEQTAAHIAHAIPKARYVTMKDCGHFPYLECPAATRREIDGFFQASLR
jgi:proline iminopeptidase